MKQIKTNDKLILLSWEELDTIRIALSLATDHYREKKDKAKSHQFKVMMDKYINKNSHLNDEIKKILFS